MKSLFSRSCLGLALLICISAHLASCTPESIPTHFTVEEEQVNVPAAGGQFQVSYTLDNPDGNTALQAEYTAEWITEVNTANAGVITFNVSENTSDSFRECTVKITYGDLYDTFTVIQACDTKEDKFFDIQITDTKASGISWKVVPEDKQMQYISLVAEKEYIDSYDDDEYFSLDIAYFESQAFSNGVSFEEYLAALLQTGDSDELKVAYLVPETDYAVYAYGISSGLELLTPIAKSYVKTLPVEVVDITFALSFDIKGPNVNMTVTPSDNTQGYYFDGYLKSSIDNSGYTLEENFQNLIWTNIKIGEIFGQSISEVLEQLLSYGEDSFYYEELEQLTEYIGVAAAINQEGLICSEIAQETFTTGEVESSDNIITLEISNILVDKADINVTTTNDDPYTVIVLEESEWSGMSDEDIVNGLIGSDKYYLTTINGDYSFTKNNLKPGTAYFAIAFGYYAGTATTQPVKKSFTTDESGDASDMQFEFTIGEITTSSVTIDINVTPDNAPYYYEIAEAALSADEVKDKLEGYIKSYEEIGLSRLDYWKDRWTIGDTAARRFGLLLKGTSYKIYAFGIDVATGEYATDIVFSDTFTTLSGDNTKAPAAHSANHPAHRQTGHPLNGLRQIQLK